MRDFHKEPVEPVKELPFYKQVMKEIDEFENSIKTHLIKVGEIAAGYGAGRTGGSTEGV